MRFGFRRLVNPATSVSGVNVEGTREQRARVHEQVRLRAHLLNLLQSASMDEEGVYVTPYEFTEGARGETEEPG